MATNLRHWIWVRSRNCGCLVTWFCYELIAKPGNKTVAVSWSNPYVLRMKRSVVAEKMLPCLIHGYKVRHDGFHFYLFSSCRQFTYTRRTLISNKSCLSLRCSWSIAYRRCSNYNFMLDLILDLNRLHKDNCETRRETSECWDLVRITLDD